MARIDIYKSGSWPEFLEQKEQWLGADPPVVIVPEPAAKSQLIRALPELRPGDLFTIPELIDRYLKNRGGKGSSPFIPRHRSWARSSATTQRPICGSKNTSRDMSKP